MSRFPILLIVIAAIFTTASSKAAVIEYSFTRQIQLMSGFDSAGLEGKIITWKIQADTSDTYIYSLNTGYHFWTHFPTVDFTIELSTPSLLSLGSLDTGAGGYMAIDNGLNGYDDQLTFGTQFGSFVFFYGGEMIQIGGAIAMDGTVLSDTSPSAEKPFIPTSVLRTSVGMYSISGGALYTSTELAGEGAYQAAIIPIPSGLWLFGSAIAGLIGFRAKCG